MADKDRPTRKFSRTETFELLTNEGKSYEPEIYYRVIFDNEDMDYKLCVFSWRESATEDQVAEFGGLVDRTADSFLYDPNPTSFSKNVKEAKTALKEGKLREFVEADIRDKYDRWHEDLRPEIRELLVEFSLAYWRRELYLRKIDGEDQDGPEPEPAPEIDTGSTGTPWVTGGLS